MIFMWCKIILKENYKKYEKMLPIAGINQFDEAYPTIDEEVLNIATNYIVLLQEINNGTRH